MVANSQGLIRLPAMADVHVHLRTPGGEHKEDFRTGSMAALAGGITTLMAMPNTSPPIIHANDWLAFQERARQESMCDVLMFAGASMAAVGELQQLGDLAPALKLYMDLTYGDLRVEGQDALETIAFKWPADKVLAVHAEGESVRTAIGLARRFGRRVHLCHISRAQEIEWIAAAKQEGLRVTCEVTPHHLFLNDADLPRLGALGDMRPRLASQTDVETLWAHINTTIDCIASDHAPHTLTEKNASDNPPPGVPGLESTLPLLLTAVAEGRLSMERLVVLFSTNPRRIYGLPEQAETWIEVGPNETYEFPDHPLYTKCGWSPFAGMKMRGRLRSVHLRGKEVFRDGEIKA